MNIWVILWLLSIFVGMKWKGYDKRGNISEGLAYVDMVPVRGILAAEIVLGHFYGNVLNPGLITVNNRIGVLVVGIFLFLSGWGLQESSAQKKDYFKGFLRKHFVKIVLPIYVLYLIQICIFRTNGYVKFAGSMVKEILGSHIISYTNWFIWELLALYFLFFLLYRNLKETTANLVLAVGIVLFIVVASYFQIGSRWYGSILCFLMGIVYSQKQKVINDWMEQKFLIKLLFCTALFLISLFLFIKLEGSIVGNTMFICISTVLFCKVIIMMLTIFKVGNHLTSFLGKISYEIFIAHAGIMVFWRNRLPEINDFIYGLITIVTIIIISWAAHELVQRGQGKIHEKVKG